LKELVISILTSGTNSDLAAYFRNIGASDSTSIAEIMEANFRFNLSLEEYAKLCHRSLSSFKLDYSAKLLLNSRMNVTEIAFESAFEDVSHFSRVFKDRFGVSPMAYRQNSPVTA
jgi:AraC-like DNA-binding protein